MSEDLTIGVVGLGAMGIPMATCLAARFDDAVGYDASSEARNRAREDGLTVCDDPSDLTSRCSVLITILPNADIVRKVLLDAPALARGMPAGALVIDMSSSYPPATRQLGEELAEIGVGLVDAPVSGGVGRARQGTLTIMAGGAPGDIERAEPILSAMGSVRPVGALGNGHAMKALNNYVSAAGLVAACEALVVGQKFGLAPEDMVDVLNISTGRNNTTENKLKPYVLNRAYNAGFAYSLMRKDVHAAADLGEELGFNEPLLNALVDILDAAAPELPDGADHTRIHEWLERQ